MTSSNAARAVPAVTGDDPQEGDLAGGLITSDSTENLTALQVEHVRRRYGRAVPFARLVAALHFSGGRS